MTERDFEKAQFLASLEEDGGLPLPDFIHNAFRYGDSEVHNPFWDWMTKLAHAGEKPSHAMFVAGLVLFWIDRDVESPSEMRDGWYAYDRESRDWFMLGAS